MIANLYQIQWYGMTSRWCRCHNFFTGTGTTGRETGCISIVNLGDLAVRTYISTPGNLLPTETTWRVKADQAMELRPCPLGSQVLVLWHLTSRLGGSLNDRLEANKAVNMHYIILYHSGIEPRNFNKEHGRHIQVHGRDGSCITDHMYEKQKSTYLYPDGKQKPC